MGDSSCLIHGFSYASAIPNESKQGNPRHALGESISFGRFVNESLSWEKWSTFSHKKYVEEAERYAQPGSVAAKKAFFEAHYKKIAAQKAAALLEQENSTKEKSEGGGEIISYDEKRVEVDSCFEFDGKLGKFNGNEEGLVEVEESGLEEENAVKRNSKDNFENGERVSVSEGSGTAKQMERPLLKNSVASEDIPSVTSKKRSGLSSFNSSIQRKTWRYPATPAKPVTSHFKKEGNFTESTRKYRLETMERKRPTPNSLRSLINFNPVKEPDKEPISATKKAGSSGIACSIFRPTKNCATPLRTPVVAASRSAAKYSAATPRKENTSCSKSLTARRDKLQSPSLSTPFVLRTEERAAKRKQKLEEKFNANEVEKLQQLQKTTLKEKAGNEFRKLGQSFCFKARPLPEFYKEREMPQNQVKKNHPAAQSQSTILGRSTPKKKQCQHVSMPPPPPPLTSFINNRVANNLSKKKVPNLGKFHATSLSERRIRHENTSPNIQ